MLASVAADVWTFNVALVASLSVVLLVAGLRRLGRWRERPRPRFGGLLVASACGFAFASVVFNELVAYRLDMTMAGIVLGSILALAVALRIALNGWRGHLVGDHPFCRRCGFDLSGRPESTTVCGECGSDLGARDAVVIGERRRLPRALWSGIAMVLVVLLVTSRLTRSSWPAMGRWAVGQWTSVKPDSWLLVDIATNPWSRVEFDRRWRTGRLAPATIEAYLSSELAARRVNWAIAQTIREIRTEWAKGNVSDELALRAMAASGNLLFEPAPEAAAGECMRFALRTHDTALNHGDDVKPGAIVRAQITNRLVKVDGLMIPDAKISDDPAGVPEAHWKFAGVGSSVDLSGNPLSAGRMAQLDVAFTLAIMWSAPGRMLSSEPRDYAFTGSVKVVEPSQMHCTPLLNRSPAAQGVALSPAEFPDQYSSLISIIIDERGKTRLEFVGAWVPLAGDLFLQDNGKEMLLGPVFSGDRLMTTLKLDSAPPQDARFIFRPRNELGTRLFAPMATYQAEIEIAPDRVTRGYVSR